MNVIYKYPKTVITIILVLTVFFALQLPRLEIDNDALAFIPENNPSIKNYKNVENVFGSLSYMDAAVSVKNGTILDEDILKWISDITDRFENLPGVESVNSITNSDYITGTAEGMEVTPLADENSFDPALLKKRLLSWDIYRKNLVSDDFKSTQILIEMSIGIKAEERENLYFSIKTILDENKSRNVEYYLAGTPALAVLFGKYINADLKTLIPFVIIIVIIALYLSFRRAGGVILPLSTVLISTVWTMGTMALLGEKITMIGTVIPVILVAVGSAYGIHVISHYYDEINGREDALSREERAQIISRVTGIVSKPVILAGLTTVAGFGSLAVSEILPMRDFGIYASAGVFAALAVSLTFIPSVLLLDRSVLRRRGSGSKKLSGSMDNTMNAFFLYSRDKRFQIVILILASSAAAVYGISKLIVDSPMIEYFKPDADIRISDNFLRENFAGTKVVNIVASGKNRGDMNDPEILNAMEDLKLYIQGKYPEAGNIIGFTDFIKRMNQVMNIREETDSERAGTVEEPFMVEGSFFFDDAMADAADDGTDGAAEAVHNAPPDPGKTITYSELAALFEDALGNSANAELSADSFVRLLQQELNYDGRAYYEIPSDPAKYAASSKEELKNLITQYLLLYSGSLSEWADDSLEPSAARMILTINSSGNSIIKEISDDIYDWADDFFPEGYTVNVAGMGVVENTISNLIIRSSINSIIVSLVFVLIILTIAFRSLAVGLLSVIPLSYTILINFGLMGLTGIKLDVSTAMVGSVAVGIGIDYTIHFISGCRHFFAKGESLDESVRLTMHSSGKAILFNAFSVAAGFLVLLASNFNPLAFFGILVALTMVISSLVSLTAIPVLISILKPSFFKR